MSFDLLLVHSPAYAAWSVDAHHPVQGRRYLNGRDALMVRARSSSCSVLERDSGRPATPAELHLVHDPAYVARVLVDGQCAEWRGRRPDLAAIAARIVGGTLLAVDELLDGVAQTAVHLPGAKHRAHRDRAGGYCVFNDFAIAATMLSRRGLRVGILDFDAHFGDGTATLLREDPNVRIHSVFDDGLVPAEQWQALASERLRAVALPRGAGDVALLAAVVEFLRAMERFRPDVLFVSAGADGHRDDALSSLTYSVDGYRSVARQLRDALPITPILVGGAGGYRPDDVTPEVWAEFVCALAHP